MSSRSSSTARAQVPTSWRLLIQARHGESGELADLIGRCVPALRRWAHARLPRWARSVADTSDLVQDAIVRTLGRLDAFQPQGRHALGAYLRKAVQNRIRDEHRRVARRGILNELPDTLVSKEPSPLACAVGNEAVGQYRAALARLTQRDRELIVAHVELGYTHAQLGCMIGRSPNAARMALCRAIERLAASMREG
jgi:RNA polymerase sigma-70 factor, ECF subfamily